MTTCVHFISIPGQEIKYSSISLPMVREYARRSGATLNLITQRKFPDYPVEYELVQIFESGASFDWNLYVAPGTLLGDKLVDPTTYMDRDCVATHVTYPASMLFDTTGNIYFERNERDLGITDKIVLAHNINHELWEPLEGPFERYAPIIKDGDHHKIGSYVLSHNMAKFGLKLSGLFPPNSQFDVLSDDRLGSDSVEEFVSKVVKGWRAAP